MPYARKGILLGGVLAGAVYAVGTAWPFAVWPSPSPPLPVWPFAVLCVLALAGYVLLDQASWRMRAPLLAGLALVAVTTLPIGPTGDFGWFSYGPSVDVDAMLRRMAEQWLVSITWMSLAIVLGGACLCAAAWALPHRRSFVLAIEAGLIGLVALSVGILTLVDVHARAAVWFAGLGLLACLAVAVVASQRAGWAWLAVAGAALLTWPAMDLLEGAATSAELAHGPDDGMPIHALAVAVQAPWLGEVLQAAAVPAGLLLVVLGLCSRVRDIPPKPGRNGSGAS